MSLGARIGAGRTAEVFALPGERVCKLFYPGVPAEAVEAELRGARCADAHGLAAPRCHGRMRALGREGIVFDRVRGQSLLERMLRGGDARRAARDLADLQRGILAARARPQDGLPDARARLAEQIARAPLEEGLRREALARARSLPAGEALCHGDLHPDNAVCQGERLLALDWANLARGDARLDVARTLFLLEDAPLPSAAPAGLEALRRAAGEEYLAAMGASRGALRAFLAAVLAARAGEAPEEAAALAPRIAALFGS